MMFLNQDILRAGHHKVDDLLRAVAENATHWPQDAWETLGEGLEHWHIHFWTGNARIGATLVMVDEDGRPIEGADLGLFSQIIPNADGQR